MSILKSRICYNFSGDIMKLADLKCVNEEVNLKEYTTLRELVKKNMEHPEWLGDFSEEDLISLLNNGSKIWLYYHGDEAVCSMMLIPATEKSLKKFNLDLDYKQVADYGPSFVKPKFVGNGLQYQMLNVLNNYSLTSGYKYAVGTIHPDNIYSINNVLKDGFVLKGYKEFKRGPRNIYLKDLERDDK